MVSFIYFELGLLVKHNVVAAILAPESSLKGWNWAPKMLLELGGWFFSDILAYIPCVMMILAMGGCRRYMTMAIAKSFFAWPTFLRWKKMRSYLRVPELIYRPFSQTRR